MKDFPILPLILIFTLSNLYGQEYKLRPYSRGQIKTSVGYMFGHSSFDQGFITDDFIQNDFTGSYWQIVSFSYFFFPHWGLELSFEQSNHPEPDISIVGKKLEAIYGQEYYVKYLPITGSNGNPITTLGLNYRFQNDKFQGQVKILFRETEFLLYRAEANLKEKGSNQVLHLSYMDDVHRKLTLGPSVTAAYRLYKVFMVHLNLTYFYNSLEFDYTETFTNPYTKQSTIKVYEYNASLHTFSAGLGLTVEFGSFGNKR